MSFFTIEQIEIGDEIAYARTHKNFTNNHCKVIGKLDKTILIVNMPATNEKKFIEIEEVIDVIHS